MYKSLLLSFVLLHALSLHAQKQNDCNCERHMQFSGKSSVFGVVSNATENTPIQGAVIELYWDSALVVSTVSDSTGNYLINKIPSGYYYIKIKAANYQPAHSPEFFIKEKGRKNIPVLLNKAKP